jgi:hypothetical protein
MGPAPPLSLPFEDSCVRLCSQMCLWPVCTASSSSSDDAGLLGTVYATVSAVEPMDTHLVRELLPLLMAKVASLRFEEERTPESEEWLRVMRASAGITATTADGVGGGDDADGRDTKKVAAALPPLTNSVVSGIVGSVLSEAGAATANGGQKGEGSEGGISSKDREGRYGSLLKALVPQLFQLTA